MKNEKFKNFFSKLKVNRAVYITAVTLLVAMALVIAITVAANRSKKNDPDKDKGSLITTPSDKSPVVTTPPPSITDKKPETTPVPETTPTTPTDVESPLKLSLPAEGRLIAHHDETAQVWSDTMRDYRVHLGVDIATESGAPVYAAADGVVAQMYEDVKLGYCISVKHSDDVYTIYSNLGEVPADGIAAGVSVKAGQLIGSVGNSAMVEVAEDPHLHFELKVKDVSVDPLEYFDQATIASLNVQDTQYEG